MGTPGKCGCLSAVPRGLPCYSLPWVTLFPLGSALGPNQGPNHWRIGDFSCGASLCTRIFIKLQFNYAIRAEIMDLKV